VATAPVHRCHTGPRFASSCFPAILPLGNDCPPTGTRIAGWRGDDQRPGGVGRPVLEPGWNRSAQHRSEGRSNGFRLSAGGPGASGWAHEMSAVWHRDPRRGVELCFLPDECLLGQPALFRSRRDTARARAADRCGYPAIPGSGSRASYGRTCGPGWPGRAQSPANCPPRHAPGPGRG